MSLVSANWKALQAKLKKTGNKLDNENNKSNSEITKKVEDLWFEVDEGDYLKSRQETIPVAKSLLELFPQVSNQKHSADTGKMVALDCEYVGVGPAGLDSALARLTIVNFHGHLLFDTHIRPPLPITDYRTHISGIHPHHLTNAPTHAQALRMLQQYIGEDTVLVGHGLDNDMKVMMWHHPKRNIRDTSKFRRFRALSRGKTPGLRKLAKEVLGVDIQQGEHDSAEDARAAMLLYRRYREEWENYLFRREGKTVKAAQRAKKSSKKK